jgi:hypothetical protein
MQNCCVVLISEFPTELRQRCACDFLTDVHADLARASYRLCIVLGFQVLHTHAVIVRNGFLDHFDGDHAFIGTENIAQRFLGDRKRDLQPFKRAVGDQPDQGAFKFPDVGFDLARDVERDIVGNLDVLLVRLLLDNGNFRFEIGGLNIGNQAPFKS